jgi:hypothetical protein
MLLKLRTVERLACGYLITIRIGLLARKECAEKKLLRLMMELQACGRDEETAR